MGSSHKEEIGTTIKAKMEKHGEPHSLRLFSTGKGGKAPSPGTAEVPGADGTTRQQRVSLWKSKQRPGRSPVRASAGCVPGGQLVGMWARTEKTLIVNQSPPKDPAAGSALSCDFWHFFLIPSYPWHLYTGTCEWTSIPKLWSD